MAEIVLTAFLQVLFDKLTSSKLQEYNLWTGTKTELQKLESNLATIKLVLEDAEERQVKDKAVKNWLLKLKDAIYDADDMLDEITTDSLQHKIESQNRGNHSILVIPKSMAFWVKIGWKIKDINTRLDAIAAERVTFQFREGFREAENEDNERKQTHSFVIESEIFGREKDKEGIVDMLIGCGNGEDISVIPIVGMGGIGKTTLAQLAFNHIKVKDAFKLKMWVCVSEDFDVRKLVKAIIEAASKKRCDLSGMDLLQTQLRERLAGEKFLLVLDDVWSEDYDKWERLKTLLRGGAKGSKIIVTTRSAEVAEIMGSLPTCYLSRLEECDCWTLFRNRAFSKGGAEETPTMVAIGQEIVKKCSGIPLAIKTLGSLMHSRREEHEWLYVRDNELWRLQQEREGILPALRISYNHLPSYLKRCFSYCAVFPKDYCINKERLIQMWMAEGLIESSNDENKPLEDIGNGYFNYLLWRSFFQDAGKDGDGNIVFCKIHDLMHDLAQFIAGTECLILDSYSKQKIHTRTRHFSLVCNKRMQTVPNSLHKAQHLHTLLVLAERQEAVQVPQKIFSKFRYLHVLILSNSNVTRLSSSVAKLIHLRFIDLSYTKTEALPESITSLVNLQTLNLSHCVKIQELPKNMRNLVNLRHIVIDHCRSLWKMPSRLGELTSLQTLSKFIVGKERGCKLEELKLLNLRGELSIKNLEKVMYAREAKEAKLAEKNFLSSLKLSWEHSRICSDSAEVSEKVLDALKPHKNLKRLHVKRYLGAKFPTWMMDTTLANVGEIKLKSCRCEFLPPLGQLPLLKVLYIRGMDSVKCIGNEFYGNDSSRGFQSLEHFVIDDMPNLEKWLNPDGCQVKVLPCIKKLVIKGCPKLIAMPRTLSSLEELELRDCNQMLLSMLPSLTSLTSLRISEFVKVVSLQREIESLVNLKSLHIEICDELVSLPEGLSNLTSLEFLGIWCCSSLTSLPEIKGLVSLRELSILNCMALSSLADGLPYLTALEKLNIEGCPDLIHLPEENIKHLTSLQSLRMSHCPHFKSLPTGLQYVTTLKDLHIVDFSMIQSLPEWIGNLKSLRELSIWDCPNLTSLPNAMQHLTSLEYLSIWRCPNVEARCERDEGEDWHKIAHVREINIKDQEIVIEELVEENEILSGTFHSMQTAISGNNMQNFLVKIKGMKTAITGFMTLEGRRMNTVLIKPCLKRIKTVSLSRLSKLKACLRPANVAGNINS